MSGTKITVEADVKASLNKVWVCFTEPGHITKWNSASVDWHTPRAENDLRAGGNFLSRMESRDGKEGFDFEGTYTDVVPEKRIVYVMKGEDARQAEISFSVNGQGKDQIVHIVQTFDPENVNPIEMQKGGWQAILDSFKKYVERL